MYLSQVLSPQEIRMSVQLGQLYPLHAGGSSKAILAALDAEQQRQYVHSVPLDALTDITIQTPERLLLELEEISRRGYSVSLGERQAGAASVAAAVFDATGKVHGSISVCGPVNRLDQSRIDEFGPLVAETAATVSRQLGLRAGSPHTSSATPFPRTPPGPVPGLSGRARRHPRTLRRGHALITARCPRHPLTAG